MEDLKEHDPESKVIINTNDIKIVEFRNGDVDINITTTKSDYEVVRRVITIYKDDFETAIKWLWKRITDKSVADWNASIKEQE